MSDSAILALTPTPVPPSLPAASPPAPSPTAVLPVASSAPVAHCTCPHLTALLERQVPPLPSVPPAAVAATPTGTAAGDAGATSAGNHVWQPTVKDGDIMRMPPPPQPLGELHALMLYAAAAHVATASLSVLSSSASSVALTPIRKRRSSELVSAGAQQPCCSVRGCPHPTRTLMACLECVHIGCWAPRRSGGNKDASSSSSSADHSRLHAASTGHLLALDLSRLNFYCFSDSCGSGGSGDFVYHSGLEAWLAHCVSSMEARKRRRELALAARCPELLLHGGPSSSSSSSSSSSRLPVALDLIHSKARFIGRDPLAGLRGLVNLGNTCFMSVVLQSLIHNPLLKHFFLRDEHSRHRCQRRNKHQQALQQAASSSSQNRAQASPSASSSVCLACDLDDLFSSFYSGVHTPLVPDGFLLSMWTHADHLAGYAQQDAHELLMAVLDGVHDGCCDDTPPPPPPPPSLTNGASNGNGSAVAAAAGPGACRCVVHRVFGGLLRSDVRCTTCGQISTALDAMLDLSLDIAPHGVHTPLFASAAAPPLPPTPGSSSTSSAPPPLHGTRLADHRQQPLQLVECLARFTRVEKLLAKDRFNCSRCASAQESSKQMSLQRMPQVLCLHLKRFDHAHMSLKQQQGSKLDHFVQFPLVGLDLAPYVHEALASPLSPAVVPMSAPGDGSNGAGGSSSANGRRGGAPQLYDCFCVIVHRGSLDTGHYFCYVRLDNAGAPSGGFSGSGSSQWFKIDDRVVTRADEREVEAQHAYLLFYIKQQLPVC